MSRDLAKSRNDADAADETELDIFIKPSSPHGEPVGRAAEDGVKPADSTSDLEAAKQKSVVDAPKAPDPKDSNMKYVALISLTLIQTLGPLQTAWTRRQNLESGGARYLNSSIILFGECTKVVAAFILLSTEEAGPTDAARAVHRQLTGNIVDNVKMAVPGLLYAVQGNLLFYSMDKLSPPVFVISYQLKILTTAILCVILLGKKIGGVKWAALILLTVGVALVQLQDTSGSAGKPGLQTTTASPAGPEMSNAIKGFVAVLAACCTSGLAGVYLEKMLTQTSTSIWMRNVQLGLIGAVMASLTGFAKDFDKIVESGFAQGFGHREFMLVMTHALGGLCSAAVLKYAGNILKCFAAAISVVLVSFISIFLTGFMPDMLFVTGVTCVIAAVFLYNVGLPAFMSEYWSSNAFSKAVELNIAPLAETSHGKNVN